MSLPHFGAAHLPQLLHPAWRHSSDWQLAPLAETSRCNHRRLDSDSKDTALRWAGPLAQEPWPLLPAHPDRQHMHASAVRGYRKLRHPFRRIELHPCPVLAIHTQRSNLSWLRVIPFVLRH